MSTTAPNQSTATTPRMSASSVSPRTRLRTPSPSRAGPIRRTTRQAIARLSASPILFRQSVHVRARLRPVLAHKEPYAQVHCRILAVGDVPEARLSGGRPRQCW